MYKLFQGSSQVGKRFMLHENVDDLTIIIFSSNIIILCKICQRKEGGDFLDRMHNEST